MDEVGYFTWAAWRRVPGYPEVDEILHVHVKLNNELNNLHGYFSITADGYDRHRRHGERGTDFEQPGGKRAKYYNGSAGCQHDLVRTTFPELAPFICWHLVDATGVPMHYSANAVFRAEQAFECSAHERQSYERDPMENFCSTVVFGAVDTDEASWKLLVQWVTNAIAAIDHALMYPSSIQYITKERNRQARERVALAVTWWCLARQERLAEAFQRDMERVRQLGEELRHADQRMTEGG